MLLSGVRSPHSNSEVLYRQIIAEEYVSIDNCLPRKVLLFYFTNFFIHLALSTGLMYDDSL